MTVWTILVVSLLETVVKHFMTVWTMPSYANFITVCTMDYDVNTEIEVFSMKYFGEQLKKTREENNMKQDKLASILGYKQTSISKWEQGVREPDFTMLVKIAELFNTSTDILLGLVIKRSDNHHEQSKTS